MIRLRRFSLTVFALAAALLVATLVATLVACGGSSPKSAPGDSAKSTSPSSASGSAASGSTAGYVELRSFRFDLTYKLDLGALNPLGGLPPGSGKSPSSSSTPSSSSSMPSSSSSLDDADLTSFIDAILSLLSDIKMEGAFVAPNQIEMNVTLGGEKSSFVQIGDDAWVKDEAGWRKADASDKIDFKAGSPVSGLSSLSPDSLKGAKISHETMNGVSTTRYSLDKKRLQSQIDPGGKNGADFKDVSSAGLDVWLGDGDLPVRMLMDVSGKSDNGKKIGLHFEMNLRDVNSDSIKIKAPI